VVARRRVASRQSFVSRLSSSIYAFDILWIFYFAEKFNIFIASLQMGRDFTASQPVNL
jgi:hypothetical protein